jgi:alpha-1,3-glucan synthase
MGDLIGFDGYVNASAPFNWDEYDYIWKTDRRYHDFQPGNTRNYSCQYPPIWDQDGYPIGEDIKEQMHGCRESEFDAVLCTYIYKRGSKLIAFSTET